MFGRSSPKEQYRTELDEILREASDTISNQGRQSNSGDKGKSLSEHKNRGLINAIIHHNVKIKISKNMDVVEKANQIETHMYGTFILTGSTPDAT